MVTTQRWLNAFSTTFVNAPAFNDPIAIGRNEGPGIKAPFMSHIGVRPKARICMSGEAIDTRTLASVGVLISKPIEFICALTASGSSAHDE